MVGHRRSQQTITSHGNRVTAAALDPTGTIVVSGSNDGVVRVGPVTGDEPHLLYGHTLDVFSVAVSPDGKWILMVEIPAFSTYMEDGLGVQVGATLERNVTLPLAALAESLTVTSESPLLDTKDSSQSTHYGNEYVENTPIRRNSMFDLMKAAPGMSAVRPGNPAPGVSAFGSAQNENVFLVDGNDFTGAYGGGVVPWVDTDVIEEIQIVGVGASAEYGSVQGAVFNVVSRQGGNDFQFDASYYGQFDGLTSDPVQLDCDCPEGKSGYVRDHYRDFTMHLAGPILKDRLWFFGGYQYQRDSTSLPGGDSRFPGNFDTDRTFWKINWQIARELKLMVGYHDDYWGGAGPFTVAFPYEAGLTDDGNNPSPTFANVTHIVSPNTFWEARVSGYYWNGTGVPNSVVLGPL